MLILKAFIALLLFSFNFFEILSYEDEHLYDDIKFPQISVFEGVLKGIERYSINGKRYYSFKGIPYAEPPVGELRFKSPIPKKPWIGVHDATKEGNICPQHAFVSRQYIGDEDCLYLNVNTPKEPSSQLENDTLLPVMVYFHGGGFVIGSGSEANFSSDFIVERDTVLVTLNYRLGVLGFMCLDLSEVPGNAGLVDQNLALSWIKKNIKMFGGDPDNVTIFGISAGGASVQYHMLSKMSKGLFHKAIVQSGSALNPWARTRRPDQLVYKLAKQLQINERRPKELLEILNKINAKMLVNAANLLFERGEKHNGEIFPFTPVVEKKINNVSAFLDEEPLTLLRNKNFTKVPSIHGFVQNEGRIFVNSFGDDIESNFESGNIFEYFPSSFDVNRSHIDAQLNMIYNMCDTQKNIDNYFSDFLFISGIYKSVELQSQHNNQMYLYLFSYTGNINFIKTIAGFGDNVTFHADEISYLSIAFPINDVDATAQDKFTRSRLVKMWTDFAKTGNPTPERDDLIGTSWSPINRSDTNLLNINTTLEMEPFPFLYRMKIWQDFYQYYITPVIEDRYKFN